jgi:hypothetical protein
MEEPVTRRPLHRLGPLVVAALLVAAGVQAFTATPAAAIVAGDPVQRGTFSFVAQLSRAGYPGFPAEPFCTGTLVDPYFVLTAVHCVERLSAGEVTVQVGNVKAGADDGAWRRVGRILRHPDYRGAHNDVALLELTEPVKKIAPVRLATPGESHLWSGGVPLDVGFAVGWGAVDGSGTASTVLRSREMIIDGVTPDSASVPKITTSVGACYGDSGGPLLVFSGTTLVQAGVAKAVDCATMADYSIVGDGPNREWILRHLNRHVTPFGVADWDADGFPDVIARHDWSGELWLYPGAGKAGDIRGTATLLNRSHDDWGEYAPFGVADWDRDGHQDLFVREEYSGRLWLLPGSSVRGEVDLYGPSMGGYFGCFTPFGLGDWDRDGYMDLLVRNDVTGILIAFLGDGTRGQSRFKLVSLGDWSSHTPYGLVDWDRDGDLDIITRNERTQVIMPTELVMTPVQAQPGRPFDPSTVIGRGWQSYHPFGIGDWNRDGHQDLLTRNEETTDLWLSYGRSLRGYAYLTSDTLGTAW